MRKEYELKVLSEKEITESPYDLFSKWYQEAIDNKLDEPYAFTLTTLNSNGFPEARIVLMRSFSDVGFVFYTNYKSNKGKSMALNPKVGINFFWQSLEKQIRINGIAKKLTEEISDTYFRSRPRESQIGAWASSQSETLTDRTYLEKQVQFYNEKFENMEVPRPEHWGGYLIQPEYFEFWQGRKSRLHDRIAYQLIDKVWNTSRLSP